MSSKLKKSNLQRSFFQYFQTLSNSELIDFQKYCKSHTISLTQRAQDILSVAVAAHPDFHQLDDRLTTLFENDVTALPRYINHSFHDLSQLLQKWLIQQEVNKDELLQKQLLIRVNKKRFQHKYFFKNAEKTLHFLQDNPLEIPENWLHRQQLNAQVFYHTLSQKFTPNPSHLREMESNLDLYYYGLKIRLTTQNLLRSRFIQEKTLDTDLPRLLDFAQQHDHLIYFHLYGELIRYLQQPSDAHFQTLVTTFKNQHQRLDRMEQAIFMNLLITAISPQVNQGSILYQQKQFELYQFAIDNSLVLIDNEISPTFFNNYFMLACLLKKLSAAKRILKEYRSYLPEEIKTDLINLLKGTLFFHEKKYAETEQQFKAVHFQNPLFKVSSRILLIKSFYERLKKEPNFKNTCLAELVSFKKFISRQNTFSIAKKETYLNFIIVLRQLIKLKSLPFSKKQEAKQRIQSLLNDSEKSINSKGWLFEKLSEL